MTNFPLPANHHAETLAAHSPAVVLGHACAVTGEPLRPGDEVVVCDIAPGSAPMTTAGWATLGSCPHCGASTGLVAAYVPSSWASSPGWGAPPAPPPAAERERSPALVGGLVGLFLVAALAIAVAVFLFVVRTRDAADGPPTALPIAALTATAAATSSVAANATTPPATTTSTPLPIGVPASATPPGPTLAPTPTLFPTTAPTPTPDSPTTTLILIDPGDGGAIRALRVEDTINLSDIGRDTFNVLADVDSSLVESVIFLLDGVPFCPRGNCVENVAPYFMGGDQGGNPYDDWDWSELLGTHTLTAIPCTGDGGTGDCFAPVEVRLTISR